MILNFIMNEDYLPSALADTRSTTDTLASGDRILSVESIIDDVGWNERYRERLKEFVNIIHATTTHVYFLSNFIFLRTL